MTRALSTISAVVLLFVAQGRGALSEDAAFVRSDANVDLRIDVSDPVHILRALFGSPAVTLRCQDAADVNDSGAVDITDAIVLFGYLFQGSTAPRAPFPFCGSDPSADVLGCPEYPACNLPPLPSFTATDGFGGVAGLFLLDGSASLDPDGTIVQYSWDLGDGQEAEGPIATHAYSQTGPYTVTLVVTDSEGNTASTSRVVTTTGAGGLPEDLDPPPPGATVLRGRVVTRVGSTLVPLPAARVRIVAPPTLPDVSTRADGFFDLVAAAGPATLHFEKEGFVPAQRQARAIPGDTTVLPDAILVPLALCGDPIVLGSGVPPQSSRGSTTTDALGDRTPAVVLGAGTAGALVFAGGSTRSLASARLCIQELQSAPAELPSLAGLACVLDVDAEEVRTARASSILFTPKVLLVVEDFLDFPVGTDVPAARFDRESRFWVPSPNGVTARILGTTGGAAEMDIDGDGSAETAAELGSLGIGPSERATLASLYASGRTLWIVSLDRTGFWALSWPTAPSAGALPPAAGAPARPLIEEPCALEHGVTPENGSFHRELPVAGTGLDLCYEASRAPGASASRSVRIPLTTFPVPPGLLRILFEVRVAGQLHVQEFPAARDLTTSFAWDGEDVYGRRLSGSCAITTRVGYVYAARYQRPAAEERNFGLAAGGEFAVPIPAREETVLWQEWRGNVGALDPRAAGLGGWTLSVYHAYDPATQTLHLGTGASRFAPRLGPPMLLFAGKGPTGDGSLHDGEPAELGNLDRPWDVAAAPDGSVYIADAYHGRIRSVGTDGIISTFAGGGTSTAEGIPATQALLYFPAGVFAAQDGSVYIADTAKNSIRSVDPAGIIRTVAGNGTAGFSGDGGPAVDAGLNQPYACAAGPDGALYISDTMNCRLRRVDVSGTITTIAGTGERAFSGDGGPATRAQLGGPLGLTVAPDGSILFADEWTYRVRRIGRDGVITTLAGTGSTNYSGDGGLATLANMVPGDVDVADDGSLIVTDRGNSCIRRIGLDGMIATIAGVPRVPGYTADAAAATGSLINSPPRSALAPDGSLIICDAGNSRIRRVPPASASEAIDALSRDGTEIYRFDPSGRHMETRDALTGSTLGMFFHDSEGQLAALEDRHGKRTTILRSPDGIAKAIVSPGGLSTQIEVSPDGVLTAITDPAGLRWRFVTSAVGLVQLIDDPDGCRDSLDHDPDGRLIEWADRASRKLSLAHAGLTNGFTAEVATSLGRTRSWRVEDRVDGYHKCYTKHPPYIITEYTRAADANRTLSVGFWDATMAYMAPLADPRFGAASTLEWVGDIGVTGCQLRLERSFELEDRMDPDSLRFLTDHLTLDHRVWTFAFDAAARTLTLTSPEGRTIVILLDAGGEIVEWGASGLHALRVERDSSGRPVRLAQGTGGAERAFTLAYDAQGLLAGIADAEDASVEIVHDAAGRVLERREVPGRVTTFERRADGRVAAIAPPGRPWHRFLRDAGGLLSAYSPPHVSPGAGPTRFLHDEDGDLEQVLRPDGSLVDFSRDSAGRVTSIDSSHGRLALTWDSSRGWLSRVEAPGGVILDRTYAGWLLSAETWSGPTSGRVSRTYTRYATIATLGVNNSTSAESSIAFTRDDDGLIIAAGPLGLGRDPQNGFVTNRTLGSLEEEIVLDGFGEVTQRTLKAGAAQVYGATYERDRLGRIRVVRETIETTPRGFELAYDAAGNVESFKVDDALVVASCSYDANGNRIAAAGTQLAATFDVQDRIQSQVRSADTWAFEHSAAGERTKKTFGASVTEYEHDSLGNLRAVRLPDGRRVERAIDGLGRVVALAVDGSIAHRWLYRDGERPLCAVDASGAVTALFIHATGTRLPDAIVQGGTAYLLVPDAWGSPRLVVRADTGEIAQRLAHDPWGAVIEDSAPGFQPFGFRGGLRDPDTGLVHMAPGVDFDGETARCLARNPHLFEDGGTNLYTLPPDAESAPPLFLGATGSHRGFIHDRCGRVAGAGTQGLFLPRALDLPGPRFCDLRQWVEKAARCAVALPPKIRWSANGLSQLNGGAIPVQE